MRSEGDTIKYDGGGGGANDNGIGAEGLVEQLSDMSKVLCHGQSCYSVRKEKQKP